LKLHPSQLVPSESENISQLDRLQSAFTAMIHQQSVIHAALDLTLKSIPTPKYIVLLAPIANELSEQYRDEIAAIGSYMARNSKALDQIAIRDLRRIAEIITRQKHLTVLL
jgi:hypothetical protein